jgi:predicted metallo-beta-lactamase superfamily hydrolase
MVNASQRQRGWMFNKTGGAVARAVEVADGKVFTFGETVVKFSDPVFHGAENSDLGWVLMTTIETGGERVMFTSDVQGPMFTPTLEKILAEKPMLVVVGGPPTYLAGFRVKKEQIQIGLQNLRTLVEAVPVTVLGHHMFRDINWQSFYTPVVECAQNAGNKVYTAAEYAGKENNFLEYRRRQLFKSEPPSLDFRNWMSLPVKTREKLKPPT